MAKRFKRIEKGIESLKKEIEEHFSKIENDLRENRIERGLYHIKEIGKSLLKALEIKLEILGIENDSLEIYQERLDNLKKILNVD